jgi:hypothetical protein
MTDQEYTLEDAMAEPTRIMDAFEEAVGVSLRPEPVTAAEPIAAGDVVEVSHDADGRLVVRPRRP